MARLVTILGKVVAVDWDEDDKAVEAAIDSDDERYPLADNDKRKELLDLLGEEVKATGTVSEDEDGNKTMEVSRFEVVKEEEKEEEEKREDEESEREW